MIHWVGPGRWFVGFSVDLRSIAGAAVAQRWVDEVREVGGVEAHRLVLAARLEVTTQQLATQLTPAVQAIGVAASEAATASRKFLEAYVAAGWARK